MDISEHAFLLDCRTANRAEGDCSCGGVAQKNGANKMETLSTKINYIALIIFVICFALWIGMLFLGYLADEWSSPPGNERSFPAPKTY